VLLGSAGIVVEDVGIWVSQRVTQRTGFAKFGLCRELGGSRSGELLEWRLLCWAILSGMGLRRLCRASRLLY
jgi:hypothetical protein